MIRYSHPQHEDIRRVYIIENKYKIQISVWWSSHRWLRWFVWGRSVVTIKENMPNEWMWYCLKFISSLASSHDCFCMCSLNSKRLKCIRCMSQTRYLYKGSWWLDCTTVLTGSVRQREVLTTATQPRAGMLSLTADRWLNRLLPRFFSRKCWTSWIWSERGLRRSAISVWLGIKAGMPSIKS